MQTRYGLVIVGAGPAGSTAAYFAAKNTRLKILIVDKFCFPRVKPCGGALFNSKDWPREFENYASISSKLKKCPVNCARFYLEKRLIFERHEEHIFDHADRYQLDKLLLKEALQKKNVQFMKFNVDKIEVDNNANFILSDGNKKIAAEYIVGADGFNSIVSRFIGNPPRKLSENGLCLEYDIRCRKIDKKSHFFLLWKSELGYSWLFPTNRGYYVGLGFIGKTKFPLKKYLDEFLKYVISQRLIPEGHVIKRLSGAPDPICIVKKHSKDKILLSGDALGTVNQLSGEGIYFAMKSGKIAGEILSKQLNNPGKQYDLAIKPIIKKVTVLKILLPQCILKVLSRMIIKTSTIKLPFKINERLQKWYYNKFFDRTNLSENSAYKKYA